MAPYLETQGILLREFVPEDEAELFELDGDPEVMRYLTGGKPSTREAIQKMMARVAAQLQEHGGKYGVWAAIEKETNAFLGWFHLFPSKDEPGSLGKLFLGYRLKQKHWGKGYATEVSKALIEKAFREFGAAEVCAQAMKANQASQKVMRNAGMSLVGEFKEASFPEGSQDAVLFSTRGH
jgi:RimJ/RimL family protein N-acetyltransferase